jgi:hypothetical protein
MQWTGAPDDSQICFTPKRSIISWKISPPLSPTNLSHGRTAPQSIPVSSRHSVNGYTHESSTSGSCLFCNGETSWCAVSGLKTGLGTGRVSLVHLLVRQPPGRWALRPMGRRRKDEEGPYSRNRSGSRTLTSFGDLRG